MTELKASQFESLMISIANSSKHPQAAFNPRANVRHTLSPLDSAWRDRRTGETMALLARRDGATHVALFGEDIVRVDGTGPDARSAYRAAWRNLRLHRHDPADLLRQIDGLERKLAIAERKIAADGALQVWLYDEMGRLRARNVELALENEELTRKNEELIRKNEELARTNEELQREAVGESLADDLTAIIAALTAERDSLRQQVERLQIEQVYLRQQAEEAWERLDDLQAAQAREEEWERLPF